MRVIFAAILLALVTNAEGNAQPPATPGAHVGNAVRMMQDRRYAEAAAEFELALAASRNDDGLRLQYATCLFIQERNDDARRQFETVQSHVGDRPGISYYLALLDLRANNYSAAIQKLRSLNRNPAFSKADYYLGLAYAGAGKTTEALESLQRAARNNSRDPDVHYRLGRLLSTAGRNSDAEREFALYRSARDGQRLIEEQAPACMDALRQKPIAEARAVCAPIGDPADPQRLLLLGQLYVGAGAFADAIDPLQGAVALEPRSFEALQYLGMSYYGLRRYADARAPLEKATELNPQFPEIVTLLAKTLYAIGDYRAALPVLERAHSLSPEDTQLDSVLERLRASLKGKN